MMGIFRVRWRTPINAGLSSFFTPVMRCHVALWFDSCLVSCNWLLRSHRPLDVHRHSSFPDIAWCWLAFTEVCSCPLNAWHTGAIPCSHLVLRFTRGRTYMLAQELKLTSNLEKLTISHLTDENAKYFCIYQSLAYVSMRISLKCSS